jgi:hypothetical protein
VENQLSIEKMSLQQFKALDKNVKGYTLSQLEEKFSKEFFKYTRDSHWMQEAAGNNDNWIKIPGMCGWHVRHAIHALEYSEDTVGTSPIHAVPNLHSSSYNAGLTLLCLFKVASPALAQAESSRSAPFDPVKSSAIENDNKE